MFVIKTEVGPSAIHGTGVFACEPVAPGQLVWRYHPALDQVISDDALVGLPDAVLQHLHVYAYRSSDLGGKLVLSGDHAKFLNHDPDANTEERPFVSVTLIIHGSDDRIVPLASSENLASQIKDSKLVVLQGIGHVPTLTRPHNVASKISSFFG